eukprot:1906642-Pyramimonas_sp.AAC.1
MRFRVDELRAALRARGPGATGLKANLANGLARVAAGPSRARQGPRPTVDELVESASTTSAASASA